MQYLDHLWVFNMFRRMRQALHDIGDNSDEDDPKIETNSDGDGRESNVAEENEGEEETGEDGDEEGRGEVEDEEQLGVSEDEEEAGAAEDDDVLGGALDEEETGGTEDEEERGKGEGEETIIFEIVENPTDPPPGISRTMSDPVTQTEQSQVPNHPHLYFTHELTYPRSKTKNILPLRFLTQSHKNGPPNTPSSTQAATMTGSPTLSLSSWTLQSQPSITPRR